MSIFFSSSTKETSTSQKSCGLPTITEGCCEENENSVVDIEDMLSESQSTSVPTFKSYLRNANGQK